MLRKQNKKACENSSTGSFVVVNPQCTGNLAENLVTVCYDDDCSQKDVLYLCPECTQALKKDAKKYGYSVEVDPLDKVMKESRGDDEDDYRIKHKEDREELRRFRDNKEKRQKPRQADRSKRMLEGKEFSLPTEKSVEELQADLSDCLTEEGAMAWRSFEYAKRRLKAINEIVEDALGLYLRGK